MIVIVFDLPESFVCSSTINQTDNLFRWSSPHIHKPTNYSSWCRYCNTYKVQMHFRSKVNRGVSETWACPALFITSNAWVWLTRICQEDLSYETQGIFCYAILCPFFLKKKKLLWKVICWIKCKLSFPDNWSSYIVNVILLLKGFYSMLCASGCPFLGDTKNYGIPSAWPGFRFCCHGRTRA